MSFRIWEGHERRSVIKHTRRRRRKCFPVYLFCQAMAFLQQPINATYLQRHSTEVRSHAISSSQGQRKVPCTGGRYTAICHVYPGTELLCKCRLCWCRTIIPCKAKFVLDILYQDANPRLPSTGLRSGIHYQPSVLRNSQKTSENIFQKRIPVLHAFSR